MSWSTCRGGNHFGAEAQRPAERLWAFVNEPLVNGYFKTLDDVDKAVANVLSNSSNSAK